MSIRETSAWQLTEIDDSSLYSMNATPTKAYMIYFS